MFDFPSSPPPPCPSPPPCPALPSPPRPSTPPRAPPLTLLLPAQAFEYRLKYPKHVEVIKDIEPVADAMVSEILLETGEPSWQASDFLPDLSIHNDAWVDDLKELRAMSDTVSDELLVILIGDMVTEEALPTYASKPMRASLFAPTSPTLPFRARRYQTLLNTFEGCNDPDGNTDSPWARWSRGWTSEENRHGDLLNRYLYLTGRCKMRVVEETIQHLITKGFNPKAQQDPYR